MINLATHDFIVDEAEKGVRLDRFLPHKCSDLSRSRIKSLILDGHVHLNGHRTCDPGQKVKCQDTILLHVPAVKDADTPVAQDIPLDILYEDEDVLVLNKPAGLVVHPAPGNTDKTLVNALLYHCAHTLSGIGGVKRPGIVHRLDKETSGLMVVAKNDQAHQSLASQLATRELSRRYYALVWGRLAPFQGEVEGNIGRSPRNRQKMAMLSRSGKYAKTLYETLECHTLSSFVECTLVTGRTHQIRVHLSHKGCALVGDAIYGKPPRIYGPFVQSVLQIMKPPRHSLHAHYLEFTHPKTRQKIHFESGLPQDMQQALAFLRSYEENNGCVTKT